MDTSTWILVGFITLLFAGIVALFTIGVRDRLKKLGHDFDGPLLKLLRRKKDEKEG